MFKKETQKIGEKTKKGDCALSYENVKPYTFIPLTLKTIYIGIWLIRSSRNRKIKCTI